MTTWIYHKKNMLSEKKPILKDYVLEYPISIKFLKSSNYRVGQRDQGEDRHIPRTASCRASFLMILRSTSSLRWPALPAARSRSGSATTGIDVNEASSTSPVNSSPKTSWPSWFPTMAAHTTHTQASPCKSSKRNSRSGENPGRQLSEKLFPDWSSTGQAAGGDLAE